MGLTQAEKKRLNEMKENYTRQRNKYSPETNHYWRISGKIEVINEILEELTGHG
jgi:hypothetical protein